MIIIPAIDIYNGKCVRLHKGDFRSVTNYDENPLAVAQEFEDLGFSYVHIVDLDAAQTKEFANLKIIERIASSTALKIDYGGGVRGLRDAERIFESGVSKLTCGSIAVSNKSNFLEIFNTFGNEKIILGSDVIKGKITINGWHKQSNQEIEDFLLFYEQHGLTHTICTDVARDGTLNGPSFNLYEKLLATTNLKLIASGGGNSLKDIERLDEIGCYGIIIGKAIYEKRIILKDLARLC